MVGPGGLTKMGDCLSLHYWGSYGHIRFVSNNPGVFYLNG